LRSRIVQAVEVEGMSAAARRNASCLPLDGDQAAKAQGDDCGRRPEKDRRQLHNLEPHRDMLRAIVEETRT